MTGHAVLAIDQGTTSTKALVVAPSGRVLGSGTSPLGISSPRPGWVEQDADELWRSVTLAALDALAAADGVRVLGVAVSNQRETVVAWDDADGRPVAPAISWQDQRGDAECARLATPQHVELVRRVCGLDLGSMYSASKMAWFARAFRGRPGLRLGTVDTWLLHCLTGGAVYATEAGNASRTLLLDLERRSWSEPVARLFGLDAARLADVRPSTGGWGGTRGFAGLPDGTPILSVLGDSHAALYGHWALTPTIDGLDAARLGKATYGTGSSVMLPADGPGVRVPGVGTTLAWESPDPVYALEGNILYSGAGLDWLASLLGVGSAAEVSGLAGQASDAGGAVFVPALNGLGAPWWDAAATGTLTGLTAATTRAQVARAGIEAVAHQVCDVVEAMDPDDAHPALHAGGGATASAVLMQTQANLLGRTLLVSRIADSSALGAAALAFRAAGVPLTPSDDLAPRLVHPDPAFTPDARTAARAAWRDALGRAGVAVSPNQTSTPSPTQQEKERS